MKFVSDVTEFRSLKDQVGLQVTSGKTKEQEFVANDDFVTHLLNQQGIIQLGEYYFRIDLNNSSVYVSLNKAELEGVVPKTPMVFSVNEDVLDLIEAGFTQSPDYSVDMRGRTDFWKWFCRDRNAINQQQQFKNDELSYTVSDGTVDRSYSAKLELEYNAVGIYFELKADVKSLRYEVPFWYDNVNDGFAHIVTHDYYFKVRCGRTEAYNGDWPTYAFASSPGKCKQVYYTSTSGLKEYEVSATLFYNHVNTHVDAKSLRLSIKNY